MGIGALFAQFAKPYFLFYFTLGVKFTENGLVVVGPGRILPELGLAGHNLLVILSEGREEKVGYGLA